MNADTYCTEYGELYDWTADEELLAEIFLDGMP